MDDSTTYCIYRIVNVVNGKCYIGLTVDPQNRKRQHFSCLKRGDHHNTHLQFAYAAYGPQSFYFEVIERELSFDNVKEREQHWIAYFDAVSNGYNMTRGGDATSTRLEKPCKWNGVEYRSVSEAARANNLTAKGMRQRLQLGYTCEADFKTWQKRCVWNGVEYPSIKAAARANNTTKAAMEQRIRKGYTCDADVQRQDKPCTWNGIEYPSVKAAAKANNVNPQNMGYWLLQGWVCDDDIPVKGYACTWNGVEYSSIAEAARALGINRSSLETRFKRGYTCDADMQRPRKT